MFFDDLIGKKIDIKLDIKANIVNIFNQRCSCSLTDYFDLINSTKHSIYKYYGIVDLFYLTENTIDLYSKHLEIAIKKFETRIKDIVVSVITENIIVDIIIDYKTYLGNSGTLNMKLTRR